MHLHNILWWLCFLLIGIWAQSLLPGVDFLAAGLVVSLQEERLGQTAWLAAVFILIQEGAGSLAFGSGLLWYGALVVFYIVGRWLFDVRNVVFILLLGAGLGLWHYILVNIMAALQDYTLPSDALLMESALQVLVFPVAWGLTFFLRPLPEEKHDALAQ